jgi:hypothetical protein
MPTTPSTRSRTRLGAAAGLLGVAAALTAVTGAGPAPSIFQLTGTTEDVRGNCDEVEHAADAACAGALTARQSDDDSSSTSSTIDDSTSTTAGGTAAPTGEVRTVSAGDAGSIMVAVDGTSLQLLTAAPNSGWQVEVEHASGREVEVTFRSGSVRVDVNVEFEDGQVRERVRTRDDATDAEIRVENGVVVRDDAPDSDDDSSGPGSGSDDLDDDSSGHGSDDSSDDDSNDDDDDDSSGHGSDDVNDDDSSGHGSDDGPGHD